MDHEVAKTLTPNPGRSPELTSNLILDEMEVENRLNDEVRDILGQYSDYMRQEDVGRQERIDNNGGKTRMNFNILH